MSAAPLLAGVEIGGTKCICTLADDSGVVVDSARIDTGEPDATLAAVSATLSRWFDEHEIAAIGIATFGPVDLDPASRTFGSIVSTPKPGWSGTDVLAPLEKFGRPLAIETDVNAAAFAEASWGAAQGLDSFAYITVGTGIGVGLINRGQTIAGRGHCEMGHLLVKRPAGDDWPGVCPYHGDCAEGLASGTAIRAHHGPGDIADDWPGWHTVENALAVLLHNLFVTAQPRRVLLGGGVIDGRPWLIDTIRDHLIASLAGYFTAEQLMDDLGFLSQPGLGARAGPLGSIAMALRSLAQTK